MKELTEKVLSRQVVFDGKLLRVEHWQVALPDGSPAMREIVCHRGASAVVPLDGDGNVILVRQYRASVGRLTLEIPAGKWDADDEDPLACARRELSEETGYTAADWTPLTVLETTPGFCDERIHLYMASGLQPGVSHPDEGEFLNVERVPLREALEMVTSGRLHDGKTVCGILMAARLSSI